MRVGPAAGVRPGCPRLALNALSPFASPFAVVPPAKPAEPTPAAASSPAPVVTPAASKVLKIFNPGDKSEVHVTPKSAGGAQPVPVSASAALHQSPVKAHLEDKGGPLGCASRCRSTTGADQQLSFESPSRPEVSAAEFKPSHATAAAAPAPKPEESKPKASEQPKSDPTEAPASAPAPKSEEKAAEDKPNAAAAAAPPAPGTPKSTWASLAAKAPPPPPANPTVAKPAPSAGPAAAAAAPPAKVAAGAPPGLQQQQQAGGKGPSGPSKVESDRKGGAGKKGEERRSDKGDKSEGRKEKGDRKDRRDDRRPSDKDEAGKQAAGNAASRWTTLFKGPAAAVPAPSKEAALAKHLEARRAAEEQQHPAASKEDDEEEEAPAATESAPATMEEAATATAEAVEDTKVIAAAADASKQDEAEEEDASAAADADASAAADAAAAAKEKEEKRAHDAEAAAAAVMSGAVGGGDDGDLENEDDGYELEEGEYLGEEEEDQGIPEGFIGYNKDGVLVKDERPEGRMAYTNTFLWAMRDLVQERLPSEEYDKLPGALRGENPSPPPPPMGGQWARGQGFNDGFPGGQGGVRGGRGGRFGGPPPPYQEWQPRGGGRGRGGRGYNANFSMHNLPELHRSENRYVVGKSRTDDPEEEKRQKQVKSILNKLTPDNFSKLLGQILGIEFPNQESLYGLVNQIFDKALSEPTFCELYSEMCKKLSDSTGIQGGLPKFEERSPDGRTVIFTLRRALLHKCQTEFEKGREAFSAGDVLSHEKEERKARGEVDEPLPEPAAEADAAPAPAPEEASAAGKEGIEAKPKSPEEQRLDERRARMKREEENLKARRRALGNIHFIGHLFRKSLLTRKIILECSSQLLRNVENPDPEDVEALCKLMTTVGKDLEQPRLHADMPPAEKKSALAQAEIEVRLRGRACLLASRAHGPGLNPALR